jgi:glycosyltransferase involved in cell wall biosynthesis
MKIVLATSFFPPTHTAGTEKRTFGYAQSLLDRGHQVQVLCAGEWDQGPDYWNGHTDENYKGIPVRRINRNWQKSPDPNRYLYNNPKVAAFLRHCLDDWQPDILHITSCLTLSASILTVAKERNLPVVLTLTDFWFACPKLSLLRYNDTLCDGNTTSQECIRCLCWGSGAYQKLRQMTTERIATNIFTQAGKIPLFSKQRGLRGMALNIADRKAYLSAALALADVIYAPSNHLAHTMRQSGVGCEIRTIQSGHDLSWMTNVKEKRSETKVRFGYIGQIIPTKGVHILLEAFCSKDWQDRAELNLFGSTDGNPKYRTELETLITMNRPNIVFHPPFPHAQLGEVLSGLDVLIVPSTWHENNPRVIQEAFASKTPVIASDVGGIAEYIRHNENGYLFERGNSQKLCEIIEQIIADPGILSRWSTQIPRVRTIQEEMDDIEAIYIHLINQKE